MNAVWLSGLCAKAGNIVADILVGIVVLIFALVAMKRGFIDCFFSLVSTLLAIILAFIFLKPFLSWTNGLFGLGGAIETGCTNFFSKIKGFDLDISNDGIRALLEDKKLPSFLVQSVLDSVENSELATGTTVAMLLAQKVRGFAMSLLGFVVLFFLVKLLLLITRGLVNSLIERLPIVRSANHILGFAVGLLQGFLIVSAVIAVFAIIPWGSMNAFFNDCFFIGWLYNHNPIHLVFSWIIE